MTVRLGSKLFDWPFSQTILKYRGSKCQQVGIVTVNIYHFTVFEP